MSSASAITPSHAPSTSLQQQEMATVENEYYEKWPALSSPSSTSARPMVHPQAVYGDGNAAAVDNDWELLPEASSPTAAVRIVEPAPELLQRSRDYNTDPRKLKHCRSSPDLRQYLLEVGNSSSSSDEDDESSSAVLIDDGDLTSLASSSVVVVAKPGASTIASSRLGGEGSSSKLSFKETLLKKQNQEQTDGDDTNHNRSRRSNRIRKLKKPKFVVKPIPRSAKSTGDLQALGKIVENEEEEDVAAVVGETDAPLFYHQKAQGQLGRVNGKKQRPDEAKRLEIIMAKKTMQREAAAASSGRT